MPLKNLLLNSLFALIFFSCSPLHCYKFLATKKAAELEIKPLVNKQTALLYKARISLYNRHYSGLILVKQTDSLTAHITFITEIGMTIFDFEIRKNEFKPAYVFGPLNKPKTMRLLENDLKLILGQQLWESDVEVYSRKEKYIYKVVSHQRYYYSADISPRRIDKTQVKGKFFTREKVKYQYNDSLDAVSIRLKHTGLIRLKITLNRIPKQA